ncbi:MAG: glyoxylate/hydroxypyruvate reductase A [Alphaproteobacteria bacterium]|jgi:glyoxylate/hydroxypyruvate reductase A
MTLLFVSEVDRADWWQNELASASPGLEVRAWPDIGDPADIHYVLAWKPRQGVLAGLPNLKAIFSLGAGVDHIFADPDLPRSVPVTRIVDADLTAGMSEYVLLHTLRHHRNQRAFDQQQRDHVWDMRMGEIRQAWERRVSILGLGEIGSDAAVKLSVVGFKVAGWSRSPKAMRGIDCYHGADGLEVMLGQTDILVCLLPLTPATTGILNAETFAAMPRGGCIINAGRGGHLVEEDLIPALDSGQLASATLDVFATEPLPADHPFWDHPAVTVTPHNASITDPRSVAAQVAENIRRHRAGEPLLNLVDPEAGY